MTSVYAYLRISSDREGLEAGVDRQRQDCHTLADSLGLTIDRVFEDNDKGASELSRKPRPGYDEMLRLARETADDVVILAYSTSRLTRRVRDHIDWADLAQTGRLRVHTKVSGDLTYNTADKRALIYTLAAWDAAEAERTGERVRRANDTRAEQGAPHGKVAFGWDRVDGVDVVNLAQAAVLQEARLRLMDGDSLRSICTSFVERGVPAPPSSWRQTVILRQMLLRDRNAGLRVHRGTVVGRGAWDALWTPEEHDALRAVLTDPARKNNTGAGRPPKHLLSGLITCGLCGSNDVRVYVSNQPGNTSPRYGCRACHRIARNQAKVDEYVVGLILDALASPDAGRFFGGRPEEQAAAEQEVAVLRGRLDEAADAYSRGLIDLTQLERISDRLTPEIKDAAARARAAAPTNVRGGAIGGTVDEVRLMWDASTLDERRSFIRALMTITLHKPSRPGNAAFDYDAVQIDWHAPGAE